MTETDNAILSERISEALSDSFSKAFPNLYHDDIQVSRGEVIVVEAWASLTGGQLSLMKSAGEVYDLAFSEERRRFVASHRKMIKTACGKRGGRASIEDCEKMLSGLDDSHHVKREYLRHMSLFFDNGASGSAELCATVDFKQGKAVVEFRISGIFNDNDIVDKREIRFRQEEMPSADGGGGLPKKISRIAIRLMGRHSPFIRK